VKPDEVQGGERELLARARSGDGEAFGEFVWRHQDSLYALALRRVGPDLAADVAREACLRAWPSPCWPGSRAAGRGRWAEPRGLGSKAPVLITMPPVRPGGSRAS